MQKIGNTIALGYNNLSLGNMLFTILHILWYKLIPHKACVFLPCLVQHI